MKEQSLCPHGAYLLFVERERERDQTNKLKVRQYEVQEVVGSAQGFAVLDKGYLEGLPD